MFLCAAHRRKILTNKRKVFERDESLHLKTHRRTEKKVCIKWHFDVFMLAPHRRTEKITYNPDFDFGAVILWSDLQTNTQTYSIDRVTCKEWDCKDDLKLYEFDDSEIKLSLLLWIWSFKAYLLIIWQRKNHKYKIVYILYNLLWSIILWE